MNDAPALPSSRMTARVLMSSLVGTTVEFYDFYIYATAASLIFGPLFFPASVPSAELIGAYASFGVAFVARPFGGAVFGHFGDRIGRKATLVASLVLMGVSTAAIGLLPTYAVAGWLAPALLCLMRFGQGLALGGEWTGAALLALENAPAGWRARYAMFAPLGAPIGFVIANGLFLFLTLALTLGEFADWGWRVPFLASAPLVLMGLWVRSSLAETPEFKAAVAEAPPPRIPLIELIRTQPEQLLAGTFGVVACFSLYYTATAFALGYGTSVLKYDRSVFLLIELGAIVFMAISIVLASWLSDRLNPSRVLIVGSVGTILSGVLLAPMLGSGSLFVIFLFLSFALLVMGFVNGPLGAWLPSLFPPRVRYSGTSVAFNIGGIVGGAFSPMISQALADESGLVAVGFYLAITGGVSLIAFDVSARRRATSALAQSEQRYRSIFEQNHVALCELNLSGLQEPLDAFHNSQRASVDDYLTTHHASFAQWIRGITFIDANEATVHLFGLQSRKDILGSISPFIDDPDSLTSALFKQMIDGGGRFERQLIVNTIGNRKVTVILVVALPSHSTSLERVACAIVDVTEREQAKTALLAAQDELARAGRIATVGAVSASIAHEVNQPIGAMVMSAQACLRWLKRETPDIESASRAAERAVKDGMRASEIVQRTREQLHHAKRRSEPTDLGRVVTEALHLLDREVSLATTKVRTELSVRAPVVLADRVEIQQVAVNLITNALHALERTPSSKREMVVKLTSHETGKIRLSVTDNGTGILPDNLSKLFGAFFTTKQQGMGIGLAICKSIVEAHGGTLTAHNNELGGATFDVVLPLFSPPSEQTVLAEQAI